MKKLFCFTFFALGFFKTQDAFADIALPDSYVNQNISNSGYSIAEPIDVVLAMVWK